MTPLLRAILYTFKDARFNPRTNEAHFSCPQCGRENFFFNVSKRVGVCHHSKCKWKPRLKDISKYLKLSVSAQGERSDTTPLPAPGPISVTFPTGSVRLITRVSGHYMTRNQRATEEIAKRGVSVEDQFIYGLRITDDRVIIPVYENNKLVNYVSRLIWWLPLESKCKYLYCPGVKTNNYIFNWDNVKHWDRITLVENSFNAIIYNNEQVTTNFGSYLSPIQIEKLPHGRVESIVLLWDEGAEESAEKAVKPLRGKGIPSCFVRIKGQPDNHEIETIRKWIREGHIVARKGRELFYNGMEIKNTR